MRDLTSHELSEVNGGFIWAVPLVTRLITAVATAGAAIGALAHEQLCTDHE